MFERKMLESSSSSLDQLDVDHQPDLVVVAGLETVVAKAAVSNQLQTFGSHQISRFFIFVTSLQHGLEESLAKVGKRIFDKVGNFKVDKSPFQH